MNIPMAHGRVPLAAAEGFGLSAGFSRTSRKQRQ
jgi:hypothetical protein